ncbi:putative hydrolase [Starmerella bacillaris]|uniref:Hydrolase n=1 Tax=Starmerella bacillaris TaxID=1247836 RepID=A0AAV5RKP2_STABA|nr:putative hydrolase [Starmerella bacillaris]
MAGGKLRIAVGQLTSTSDLKRNAATVSRLIEKAFSENCEILFLPEATDYIAGSPSETIALAKPLSESPFFTEVEKTAKKFCMPVSVGVHEPTTPSGSKVMNNLLWLHNGEIANRYQKIHLFDADVPNGPILRESASVERGSKKPQLFEMNGFTFGPQICYDIRFPEAALDLRKRGANVLLYPSAFTVKTGIAHWRALNRARAIDNQCYVVSAAQVGVHDVDGKRMSYGHSIVVDPWGNIVAESEKEDEDLLVVVLDEDIIDQVRGNMPLLEQREETFIEVGI